MKCGNNGGILLLKFKVRQLPVEESLKENKFEDNRELDEQQSKLHGEINRYKKEGNAREPEHREVKVEKVGDDKEKKREENKECEIKSNIHCRSYSEESTFNDPKYDTRCSTHAVQEFVNSLNEAKKEAVK
ncbi:hypothetical protein M9H77_07374 [Catharanthus roseus]|uniref:Uncharacterized protein n=1 Tax=Catharanthus roseus TaxID=4058 RepID=A0ACC0BV09_CATRO|nr:hypothetical protein M9H77_07374 [Catharanthus roseus]